MAQPTQFTYSGGDQAEPATRLRQELSLQPEAQRKGSVTFLDTFDWRVYRAGYLLAHHADFLELSDRRTGAVVARVPTAGTSTADPLPGALRDRLADLLAPRALLPVALVASADVVLAAHNADAKTVARLVVSDSSVSSGGRRTRLPRRVSVVPLRGYDREAARLSQQLAEMPGMQPADSSLFEQAVVAGGRRPGDYSSKLSLTLSREMPAGEAARLIYRTLLQAMRVNEDGVLGDLDSEFLHDYRVAVRRTRSALKELTGVLPSDVESHFREEFRWLGQVTTPTRDLDVYLLDYPGFRTAVGDAADDLEPLHELMVKEQARAHRELDRALRSTRYRDLLAEWSRVLETDPAAAEPTVSGGAPIGALADHRIYKVARRVLRNGTAIDDSSPAEALHDLRKRCKELRYLLEFFASLYDRKVHGALVTALKGLQDNLGLFQDAQVQRHAIEEMATRLQATGVTPAPTLLAIGRLVGALDDRQRHARAEFAGRFTDFAAPQNRSALATLTGTSQ